MALKRSALQEIEAFVKAHRHPMVTDFSGAAGRQVGLGPIELG